MNWNIKIRTIFFSLNTVFVLITDYPFDLENRWCGLCINKNDFNELWTYSKNFLVWFITIHETHTCSDPTTKTKERHHIYFYLFSFQKNTPCVRTKNWQTTADRCLFTSVWDDTIFFVRNITIQINTTKWVRTCFVRKINYIHKTKDWQLLFESALRITV